MYGRQEMEIGWQSGLGRGRWVPYGVQAGELIDMAHWVVGQILLCQREDWI